MSTGWLAVMVLLGAGVGAGLVALSVALFAPRRASQRRRREPLDIAQRRRLLGALGMAIVVGVVTRTVAGVVIGAVGGWVVLTVAMQPSAPPRLRLEQLAAWIELLRDAVAANRGLVAAVEATAAHAPDALRGDVEQLVGRLRSQMDPAEALRLFADNLADGAADEAIAPLVLASRFGAGDLQPLLAAAAVHCRELVALGRRTDLARSRPRREMRIVAATTVGFVGLVLVVGGGYFHPFTTLVGQIVVLAIAALFAGGFAAMARLARPPVRPRLFTSGAPQPETVQGLWPR